MAKLDRCRFSQPETSASNPGIVKVLDFICPHDKYVVGSRLRKIELAAVEDNDTEKSGCLQPGTGATRIAAEQKLIEAIRSLPGARL